MNGSGALYVAGSTDLATHTDVVLARHATNGALDTGFDGDGLAFPVLASTNDVGMGVTVQTDGKPVVAANRTNLSAPFTPRLAAFRFTTGGTLDTTYSGDGIAEAAFGTNGANAAGVVLDSTGRAIVFGSTSDVSTDWDFAVARFTTGGAADTTFNSTGLRRVSIGAGIDNAWAAAVQSDDRILVAGSTTVSGGTQYALIRLNINGSLDTGFDGDGILVLTNGTGNLPRNDIEYIGVLPTGKILIAGRANTGSPDRNVLRVGRINADGSVDTTFGTNGFTVIDNGTGRIDQFSAGSLQFDEKLVVFGGTTILSGGTSSDFLMTRVNWDDGSLDTTFGSAGLVQPVLSSAIDTGSGGQVLADGRQVMVGYAAGGDMGSARFLADPAPTPAGTPDLVIGSDSGRSNTDNITNDNTPTFSGTCVVGETAILLVNGTEPVTRARHLCRSTTYSLTPPTLTDGTYTFTVREINGAGQAAVSAGLNVTIDTVAAAPAITSPTNGSSVTIPPSATVTGNGAEATADIEVRTGSTVHCAVQAAASPALNAAFSCNAGLGLGVHAITARQTDVAGNVSTNSTTVSFTQNAATTTTLTSSANPSRFGQQVTLTATVASVPAGFATPSGCVVFTVAGSPTACVALTGGVATTSTSSLPVGSHAVSVAFAQQNFFLASNQTLSGNQQVIKSDTSLALTSSVNPSVFGQPVTLTMTATPTAPGAGTPGGTVSLDIDGSAQALSLSGGTVQNIQSGLTVGTHTVSAAYAGDTSFNGSASAIGAGQVVNKANVAISLTPPAFTPVANQLFSLTINFAGQAPSLALPGGVATLTVNGNTVQTYSASALPQSATLNLNAGTYNIVLSYPGDAGFNSGNSSLAAFNVARATTSLGILVDIDPSLTSDTKTFTVQAAVVAPGSGTVAGNVDLTIGNLAPISLPLTGGQATHATNAIPAGSWTVSASYPGDANQLPATSNLLGGITVIDVQVFRDGFE
ncbi:MAG: Ig-like domain repeat protein [Ahniella sp.]|nr:Ig-like domain repeat protein [Ahniella sp.]